MNREEALNKAIGVLTYHQVNFCKSKEAVANMNEIIEALEKIDQEQCGDCISREAVENAIKHAEVNFTVNSDIDFTKHKREVQEIFNGIIDAQIKALRDLLPVTPQQKIGKWIYKKEEDSYRCSLCGFPCHKDNLGAIPTDYCAGCGAKMRMKQEPQSSLEKPNKWIPITSRPMTEEEKEDFAERTGYDEKDFDDILSCPLPEDGETVLITDRIGNVEVDTFINDCDGCYFECNCDMEDVKAWMPLPQPYQSEIPTGEESEG